MNKSKTNIKKIKDVYDKSIVTKKLLFDMPFRIGLTGRSGSGKTNILVNLLDDDFYGKDFDSENIYIISGSLSSDNKIKDLVKRKDIPLENLYNGYKEDEVTELYNMLQDNYNIAMYNKEKPEHSLVIFDDVSFDNSLKNKSGGIIDRFACNSRKFLVSIIFTSQKYTQFSTCIRENLTGIICASCSDRVLDLISDDFNMLGDRKLFRKMFRKITDDKFQFFVTNLSNDKQNRYLTHNFEPVCVCEKGNKKCKNKMI